MNVLRRLGEWLGKYYDRLVAVVSLAAVAAAIVWGVIRIGTLGSEQHVFSGWMTGIMPAHPTASVTGVARYEQAQAHLLAPPQISEWTNSVFVPETRCWCVDCLRPIPLDAMVCPFCRKDQPPIRDTKWDSDLDGLPDDWEKEHGFDHRNAADAALDPDGDGFTTLEEFSADPPTNPTDPVSHPAYAAKLVIGQVVAEPFRLLFQSYSTLPEGAKKFAINTRSGGRTYFAKLHESVEGFELWSFQEKFEVKNSGGVPLKMDVSILTLRREGKLIPLPMGGGRAYVEHRVNLLFTLDKTQLPVKLNEPLDIRGETYKVIAVDIEKETVVIERLPDGKRFDIRKAPQAVEHTK